MHVLFKFIDLLTIKVIYILLKKTNVGLISAGHRYSASRLHAQNTPGGYIAEISSGLEYLKYIRELA